jgi:membrane protein
MASLADFPEVIKSVGAWNFLKRVYQQVNEDGIFVWASALAYSWLFSIFPFLILLISLVPYLPRSTTAQAQNAIDDVAKHILGKEADTISSNVNYVVNRPHKGWLGIGLAVSLWVASGGMSMTMSALDKCYDVKVGRSYFKQRFVAILLTLGVTVCMLFVIVLLPIGSGVMTWLRARGKITWPIEIQITWPLELAFDLLRYGLSLFFSIVVLGMVYYFGPSIQQKFRLISPGAVFSALVWILCDVLFRIYIDKYARYDQTYGAVGGVAILLLFFYLGGLVLLIGAEINSEIDFERLGVPPGAMDLTGPPKSTPIAKSELTKEL